MGIGIIPFNHSSWYPYFSECPKKRHSTPNERFAGKLQKSNILISGPSKGIPPFQQKG